MIDEMEERHDSWCEGDEGGRLPCSCAVRQEKRVSAVLDAARALQDHWDAALQGDLRDYAGKQARLLAALSAAVCEMGRGVQCGGEVMATDPDEMAKAYRDDSIRQIVKIAHRLELVAARLRRTVEGVEPDKCSVTASEVASDMARGWNATPYVSEMVRCAAEADVWAARAKDAG